MPAVSAKHLARVLGWEGGWVLVPLMGLRAHSQWQPWLALGQRTWDLRSIPARRPHWSFYPDSAIEGVNLLLPSSFLQHKTWLEAPLRARPGTKLSRGVGKDGSWSEWVKEP